jgi:hypothetical protein
MNDLATILFLVAIIGWVADQTLKDLRHMRLTRRRPRH